MIQTLNNQKVPENINNYNITKESPMQDTYNINDIDNSYNNSLGYGRLGNICLSAEYSSTSSANL